MKRDILLRHANLDGIGLEIGPSYNPLAPKREGFRVEIIDHMDRAGLVAKYHANDVSKDAIEEVDYVWRGQSYAELTGKRKHYDWIIASHVIEHVPDLVAFLNDCDAVLKDDGILALAVPDKRYCFDRFRPVSGLSAVVDRHYGGAKTSTPGAVAEHYLSVVFRRGSGTWSALSPPGAYRQLHNAEEAAHFMKNAAAGDAAIDIHAWCFVPHSFRMLIEDLNALGLIALREIDFVPSVGCEFFITLGRRGRGTGLPRMTLARRADAEQRAGRFGQILEFARGLAGGLRRRVRR